MLTAIAVATERIGLIATASTHVLRAVQPGSAVRLARPHLERTRGVEHRHHGYGSGGSQLRAGQAPGSRGPVFACKGIRRRGGAVVGQLGGRRDQSGPERTESTRTETRFTRSTTSGGICGCGDRSTHRGLRRDTRCWCRPVRPTTVAHLPVSTRRRSSQPHQRLSDAQAFYIDIKSRAAQFGRNPDHVKILPGISPFIGDTEEQAKALEREFNELTSPEYGLAQLGALTGADVRNLELDAPVPVELFAACRGCHRQQAKQIAGDRRHRRARASDGSWPPSSIGGCARGTGCLPEPPSKVADTIEEWFTSGAADGFNVMPPYYPGGLEIFTERVVPILQDRGLFRTEYSGTTLRDHFGLPRPESQFSGSASAVQ